MTDAKSLYEKDYALWLDRTIADLKAKRLEAIDWQNLIEEVEGLAGRDRRELLSRLTTLLEHLLKRKYINLPECYRGWEVTIRRTRIEIERLLSFSPSLSRYFISAVDDCYCKATLIVNTEYGVVCPEECPFPSDPDRLLNDTFWE